jgi:hypothetical protein
MYGSWCIFSTPDAESGVCGAPPLAAPTPCSLFANDSSLFCPFGTYPDIGASPSDAEVPSYCLCQERLALGDECTSDTQCRSLRCGAVGDGMQCISRLADGEPCTGLESYCASWCDSTTSTCHAPCE